MGNETVLKSLSSLLGEEEKHSPLVFSQQTITWSDRCHYSLFMPIPIVPFFCFHSTTTTEFSGSINTRSRASQANALHRENQRFCSLLFKIRPFGAPARAYTHCVSIRPRISSSSRYPAPVCIHPARSGGRLGGGRYTVCIRPAEHEEEIRSVYPSVHQWGRLRGDGRRRRGGCALCGWEVDSTSRLTFRRIRIWRHLTIC